jgi:hypothetical protein
MSNSVLNSGSCTGVAAAGCSTGAASKLGPRGLEMADPLSTAHLNGALRAHATRGGVAVMIAHGFKFVLNIGALMVLARILTPEDFGLVAMVAALVGLISTFKDAGLSMATVQQP